MLVTIVDETTAAPAVDSLKIGELAGSAATDVRSRDVVFNIDKLSVRYAGALALREATLSVHKKRSPRSSARRAAARARSSAASTG